MKYFAVFAAVCACVLAGTLDPPPIDWCSFGVEVDVLRNGIDAGSFYLSAMKKGDTVVASRSTYDKVDIIRGDLMDSSKKIPVIHGVPENIKRDSESCSVKYVTQDQAKKYMNNIAPGMLYPFEYKTKVDYEQGGVAYDMYCNDDNECLFVKKVCDVNCLHVHTYDVEDEGGEKVSFIELYSFFSLSEMHAFYLEEADFPGCGEGSPAYTEPENICLDKYTPEQPYCAYSVKTFTTYDDDPTPDDEMTLYIMMKDDVIVGAFEADDGKGIIREDLMSPNSTTVAVAYGDTDSSPKCETMSVSIGDAEEMLSEYAGALLFPFPYEGEPEDDELDGTKCDKYCMDYYGAEVCLYVKKDCKKGCVVGYSLSQGSPIKRGRAPFGRRSHPSKRGEVRFMHFKDYKELKDMSVFTLDKEKYPGCDEDSYAYKAPEKICGSKSAGSVVKSVAVVVVAAVLAALF